MQITVAYRHRHQPAVYGPIPHQHPPIAGRGQIAVNVPLHPAQSTRLDHWPRTIHTSRRIATAIARAVPTRTATSPVVLLLANPATGMLTAIGPFHGVTDALTWLHSSNGRPGGAITSTPLPLSNPPRRSCGAHQ